MQVTAAMVKELRERTGAGMMECKKALVEAGGDLELAVDNMRKSGQAKADKRAGRVAAEGLIAIQADESAGRGVLVEVNCETDFVAKEEDFKAFAMQAAARALAEQPADVEALAALELEAGASQTFAERRTELVARIGENITLRRLAFVDASGGPLGAYSHGGRIGALVGLKGGTAEVAKDIAMHVAASRPLALNEAGLAADVLDKEREIVKAQVADSGKPPEIQAKMITGRMAKYLKEVTLTGQPFVKDPDRTVAQYLAAAGAEVTAFVRFEVGEGIEKKSENFAEEVMAQVRDSA
ncbi:MAG: translation elongation factor Ts [Gammaproteobacteria bacterium]